MAKTFLTPIVPPVLSSEPAGVLGSLYVSSVDNKLKIYDGTKWANVSITDEIVKTVSTNDFAVPLDEQSITSFLTIEYTVAIWQNNKYRTSKILVQSNRSNVLYNEFGIIEMGGTINGPLLSVTETGGYSILSITMSDAVAFNATVKILKTVIFS